MEKHAHNEPLIKHRRTLGNGDRSPIDSQINITGYSPGGHLAQVFTRFHYNEVIHTYTMNGAGFGDFVTNQHHFKDAA